MALTGGPSCPRLWRGFEKCTGIRLFKSYGMTETAAAIVLNPGRGEPLAGSVGFRAPYAKTLIAAFGSEGKNPRRALRSPADWSLSEVHRCSQATSIRNITKAC